MASVEDWNAHAQFLARYDKYSVRTFRGPRYGQSAPHFPIIGREELERSYETLLRKGLSLIVATPIDPKEAELAGCLLYNADVVSAEVALGPGTVRRVTAEGLVDLSVKSERPGDTVGDARLDLAICEVRKAAETLRRRLPRPNLDGLQFEFSWYGKPVGWRNEQLIFWELATSVRQEREIERLLPSG